MKRAVFTSVQCSWLNWKFCQDANSRKKQSLTKQWEYLIRWKKVWKIGMKNGNNRILFRLHRGIFITREWKRKYNIMMKDRKSVHSPRSVCTPGAPAQQKYCGKPEENAWRKPQITEDATRLLVMVRQLYFFFTCCQSIPSHVYYNPEHIKIWNFLIVAGNCSQRIKQTMRNHLDRKTRQFFATHK